jgi:hypothetical protein
VSHILKQLYFWKIPNLNTHLHLLNQVPQQTRTVWTVLSRPKITQKGTFDVHPSPNSMKKKFELYRQTSLQFHRRNLAEYHNFPHRISNDIFQDCHCHIRGMAPVLDGRGLSVGTKP